MADPYEQFTAGVPDIRSSGGRSVFQNSPLSSRSRSMLSANRLAATGALLETRDRMEEFRTNQRARMQAPRVIGALSQLDPTQDPYYDQKVAGILSQNPDASLDQSVQNFLGVQGGIFERSRSEQAYAQEQADRAAREEEDRRYRMQQERRGRKMQDREQLDARVSKLPPEAQRSAQDAVGFGFTPQESVAMTEAQIAREAEINDLYAAGLTEEEIQGVILPDGRVDPRKKAMLIGQTKRKAMGEDKAKEQRAADERMLKMLISYSKDAEPGEQKSIQGEIRAIQEKLGIKAPPSAGTPPPAATEPGADPLKSKIDGLFPK